MSKRPMNFQSMPTDELWLLFEEVAGALADRMGAEKTELEDRLKRLKQLRENDAKIKQSVN